ncbi:MAG TPA: MlaD family protein [Solirubrobacteraceae bacterium]
MSRARTRMQLRRARRSMVVIAVGVAAALASIALIVSQISGGTPLEGKQRVRVAVDSAKSVLPGKNEVRWAGVVVGRITDVELEGDRAVLTAEIAEDEARTVYRDATLRLRPQTALNDMYLDVTSAGTPRAGEATDDTILDAGQAQTSVDVAEVLNVFSTSVSDRLHQALAELSVGLPDGGAQLRSAFAELVPFLRSADRLASVIARRDAVTRRLVSRVGQITDELARRDRALARLVQSAGGTFQTLGERREDLDRTLRELPPALTQVRGSLGRLQGTLRETRPALAALRPAARRLPSGLTALRSLSSDLDPALRAVRPAIDALRPLARDLAPTAASLAGAFAALEPQAPRLDRVTAQVARCKTEVQKFFAWTMSVFKFGNASHRTSSPRGLLVDTIADATNGSLSNLVPITGCADGRPSP